MFNNYKKHVFYVDDGKERRTRYTRVIKGPSRNQYPPQSHIPPPGVGLNAKLSHLKKMEKNRKPFKPFIMASRKEICERNERKPMHSATNSAAYTAQNWMPGASSTKNQSMLP